MELLSQPIRRYIYEQGWPSLRPIQLAAIERILTTEDHYILASPTASGKTEAAFLPILSRISENEPDSISVLYISPLIALINDQFERVIDLCKHLDMPVTKWHGEAAASLKTNLLTEPRGVVLMTPESLEAMFVHQAERVERLFGQLAFIVVDEIHIFLGTARGRQLQSLLHRLRHGKNTRIIGLSATIGDYEAAKAFTGDREHTRVLLDKRSRPLVYEVNYFAGSEELPLSLLKDLYLKLEGQRGLIFPNSRARVEEVSAKLRRLSQKIGGRGEFFAHHAEVSKQEREHIEQFAKAQGHKFFSIVCTSTLELGIDIGSIDCVAQVDAPQSVASLIQRVGRSGRRSGEAHLLLYATNEISLLQGLASLALYLEGYVEPIEIVPQPFDVLAHQILSEVKAKNSCTKSELLASMHANPAFKGIGEAEILALIQHLIRNNMLEELKKEIILGLDGEKIVLNRDFYTLFYTNTTLQAYFDGDCIGEINYYGQLEVGDTVALAAQNWRIDAIHEAAKRIHISPTDAYAEMSRHHSLYFIHEGLRRRMLELLTNQKPIANLSPTANSVLASLRQRYIEYPITDTATQRPIEEAEEYIVLHTFTSSKINRSLQLLMELAGIKPKLDERNSQLILVGISRAEFDALWQSLPELEEKFLQRLDYMTAKRPQLLKFSKFAHLLPRRFQARLLAQQLYDLEGAIMFARLTQWVSAELVM